MKPLDLIDTGRALLLVGERKPTQANLRRAHSTAYYALFHCVARDAADLLAGGAGAARSVGAWRQTYRALEHLRAKEACRNRTWIRKFPKAIEDFANAFVSMQDKRHSADYDPGIRLAKSEVATDLDLVERVIRAYRVEPVKDRRAFCIYLLLKNRS